MSRGMPCARRSDVKIHKLNSGLKAYFTTFLSYPPLANFSYPTAATKCNVAGAKANKNTNLYRPRSSRNKVYFHSQTLAKTQTAIEKQNKEALSPITRKSLLWSSHRITSQQYLTVDKPNMRDQRHWSRNVTSLHYYQSIKYTVNNFYL